MKLNLKFKEIVENSSKGTEAMMLDVVDCVDGLIEKLRKENPEMASDFMRESYEAVNGRHINQLLAEKMVNAMWHKDARGNVVKGEVVAHNEAERLLLDGMDAEKKEECKWDAYVAANDCKGLKRCSKSIEAVSLKAAVETGRRPCKWCH